MTLLLTYLFFALSVSFICSLAEAVLLSTGIPYLKTKIESGGKSEFKLLRQKEDVDKSLSAILSLNTIAHTVGAAGVGAQATIVFGEAYFGIVSAVLTLLILILTEIIPKTLGANYNKELVGIAAGSIQIMIFISYPIVKTSSFLTRLLSKDGVDLTTSREEISTLVSIGTEEGVFAEKENIIIQNLIRLKSIRISDIKTPRVVVVVSDENMTLREFWEQKDYFHFSRIPVYGKNKDDITGYVLRAKVFEMLAEDCFDVRLKDIKRPIQVFYGSITLFKAWNELLTKREHISLVVDEYGGMDGIVTLEDFIETLLGFEIIDEKDQIEDMQDYALKRWKESQTKQNLNASDTEG